MLYSWMNDKREYYGERGEQEILASEKKKLLSKQDTNFRETEVFI